MPPSFPKYPPNRNAVILVVTAEPKHRHSAQCPLHPNFVIPRAVAESIFACQRCSHRSQSSALQYGYCDFAQYDGVGRARASLSSGILLPSFPKYAVILVVTAEPKHRHSAEPKHRAQCPLHPNFVIPRAVAESIFACQRCSHRSQRPLHSSMDTATSRSMTVLVGQGRLCPPASFSRHSRSTRRTETPSFPKYPPNRNAVIPEVPAEPKRRHSCSNRRTQTPSFRAVPAAPKLRHSARSRGIHLCLPTRVARAVIPASALCTPVWILRLRAV